VHHEADVDDHRKKNEEHLKDQRKEDGHLPRFVGYD